MCDYFHKTANGDASRLRQAYLWCVVSINSGGWGAEWLLDKMNEAGYLKMVAPEAKAFWSNHAQEREKRFEAIAQSEFKELPEWMNEIANVSLNEDLPVFSYYFSEYRLPPYLLEIYKDGRVNVMFNFSHEAKPNLWMKVSEKTVDDFLADLKGLGFKQWKLFTTTGQFCDNFDPCIWTIVKATQRENGKVRKLLIRESADLVYKESNYKSTLQVAKLQTLVEQYFPTQNIRCGLGCSESFRDACVARALRWGVLAKRQ